MLTSIALLLTLAHASAGNVGISIDAEGKVSSEEDADDISFLQTPGEAAHLKPVAAISQVSTNESVSKSSPDLNLIHDMPKQILKPVNEALDKVSISTDKLFYDKVHAKETEGLDTKAFLAEFLAMTLFVIIGCGSAMALANEAGWLLQVSLAFGLAITTLAYTIGHYSGGQINCAVTLGLCITGNLSWAQGGLNFIGQMLGSVLGAIILNAMFGEERDKTGGLGSNSISIPEGKELKSVIPGAILGEIAMTFLLMYVVLETTSRPAAEIVPAPVAIGLAVFLAHCLLIPIDGCSINPTRSFGPMLVRKICYKNSGSLEDQWVFWAGPLAGAVLAAAVFMMMTG